MTHTPGPWDADTARKAEIILHYGKTLQEAGYNPAAMTAADLNKALNILRTKLDREARLIAAAPKMLEVLNDIATLCEERATLPGTEETKRWCKATAGVARAAITEATGESK